MAEEFRGFPPGLFTFLGDLTAHNDKAWFADNRARYEKDYLEPAESFVRAFGEALRKRYPKIHYGTQRNGSGSIMRIYRDIRFSRDTRPLKTNLGLVFWHGEGKKVELPSFYFHVEAAEAFLYAGQHIFPGDVRERFRQAVDEDGSGRELEEILRGLETRGIGVLEEPEYKRVPRGFESGHPREKLLRHTGLGVSLPLVPADLEAPGLIDRCTGFAEMVQPLMEWLGRIQ